MRLVEESEVYYFDVDNTLVLHLPKEAEHKEGDITVVDPYDGEVIRLRPHTAHIKLLKRSKLRGCATVVWSLGGPKWIKLIIEALGIAEFVDVAIPKPRAYVDDKKDSSEWVGSHIFIKGEWGS